MPNIIVTTTINPPTKTIINHCEREDWDLIIIGDKKTPHQRYLKLEDEFSGVTYLSPDMQEERYKKLSDLIGWNCIQRRNIGLVEAYNTGAEVIAVIDDDNIPYNNWGKDLLVNKTISLKRYITELPVFDPLSVTIHNHLWHRGFPIELISEKNHTRQIDYKEVEILVQADLWNGDPDIDAIARIAYGSPSVAFETMESYGSNVCSPFNSQNTFLSRKIIPEYFLFPHIGRMDDIWASYWVQQKYPGCVAYCKPSVYQERNIHDLFKDLRDELIGYEHSLEFVANPSYNLLPQKSIDAFEEYRRLLT